MEPAIPKKEHVDGQGGHTDSPIDYELREWSKKLGVTPEQLRAAVLRVGALDALGPEDTATTELSSSAFEESEAEYWKRFDKPAFIRRGLAFPKLNAKPPKGRFFDSPIALGVASIFDFAGVRQAQPTLSSSHAIDKQILEQDFEVVAADFRHAIAAMGRRRK